MERNCKTCRWAEHTSPTYARAGDCTKPLPVLSWAASDAIRRAYGLSRVWLDENPTGKNCPTWEAKVSHESA